MTLIKSANRTEVIVGDIITYKLAFTNDTTFLLNSVVIKDLLNPNLKFVDGSVKINGVSTPFADILAGVNVGPLVDTAISELTFDAEVITGVLVEGTLSNIGTVVYNYIDPADGELKIGDEVSAQLDVLFETAQLTIAKVGTPNIVELGDTITYTVTLLNTGTINLLNIILKDMLSEFVELVPGSVKVNTIIVNDPDFSIGLNVGEIDALATPITVEYQVKVNKPCHPIVNAAYAQYDYELPATPQPITGTKETEVVIVETEFTDPAAPELVKSANLAEIVVGEVITYQLAFENTTPYVLDSVVIKDLLSPNLDFVEGSVKVGALSVPDADILTGVQIGPVGTNTTINIFFDALVVSKTGDYIENQSIAVYKYTDPFDGLLKIGEIKSNILKVLVEVAELEIKKEANPQEVQLNDIIDYKITLTNIGTIDLFDTIVKDLLNPALEFIPNSLFVNGVLVNSTTIEQGLNIGSVVIGNEVVIEYKAKVIGETASGCIDNEAYATYCYQLSNSATNKKQTEIVVVSVCIDLGIPELIKSSNLAEIVVGEILTYKLVFKNTTEYILNSVVVKDLLSPDLDFVEGSVKVSGMSIPNADILTGVQIGPVGIDSIVNVFFDALVISKSGDTIDNQSTAVYKYTDLEDGLTKIGDVDSNLHQVLVEIANLDIEKHANTDEVQLNDIVEYQIILRNTGTIELFDIKVKDLLSPAIELVPGSVFVDGVLVNTANIEQGLNVGNIPVGSQIIIDYKAKVVSGTCSGYIDNEAYASYCYKLPNSATDKKETEVVVVSICVVISSFKQQGLSKSITLPLAKPDIEEIDDVVVEVIIDDSYVVETMVSSSNEGQNLSGFKLVIHGRLKMSIEYTALLPTQPIHSAHCEVPFSSFLILPPDYVQGSYVEVSTELENMEVDLIDCRSAMVNVIFLIIAKIS